MSNSSKRNAELFAIVQRCFERIGGERQLADWARENLDEFYTKIWSRTLPRPTVISDDRDGDHSIKRRSNEELDEIARKYEEFLRARESPEKSDGRPN